MLGKEEKRYEDRDQVIRKEGKKETSLLQRENYRELQSLNSKELCQFQLAK